MVIGGCSDDADPTAPGGGGNGTNYISGVIGSNHGHSVSITTAQIDAAGAVTLTLSGPHTHSVALTAGQVGEIGAGTQVAATSSSDSGHMHPVTFN